MFYFKDFVKLFLRVYEYFYLTAHSAGETPLASPLGPIHIVAATGLP